MLEGLTYAQVLFVFGVVFFGLVSTLDLLERRLRRRREEKRRGPSPK